MALALGLTLGPGVARAQAAPQFTCEAHSLAIGAAEVNGLRVRCSVSGAAAEDQMLRVVSDAPRPLCEVALKAGVGECVGAIFGSSEPGQVVAVLEPSGTRFDVLAQPLSESETVPQLQYTPLPPDDDSSSD
jgi:hypothetical protein